MINTGQNRKQFWGDGGVSVLGNQLLGRWDDNVKADLYDVCGEAQDGAD
jgi:hypothetical protein